MHCQNMERFSEGLRSPLLFWECILLPAELINYKPNILLATTLQTLHISLATSTASTQLCCEVGYLYGYGISEDEETALEHAF